MSNKKYLTFMSTFFVLLLISIMFGAMSCIADSAGADQTSNRSDLVINEFMADNGITIASPDGNSPDWIELYNTGSETIDLTGMYLTDDLNDPTRWQFPEATTLGPNEYLLVWADRNGGELYASFALDANGEEIGLYDSDGLTLIDSVVFLKQIQDVSYGRIPDGGSSWNYLLSVTPGYSNQNPSVETKSSVWSLVILVIAFAAFGISILIINKRKAGTKN
ncbi:MAG: lamin tail domain-containing protein [archaeon]